MNYKFIENINRSKGVFTTKELKSIGLNHYQINKLLEQGVIEKLKRGAYIFNDSNLEDIKIAKDIVPNGVFCMHTAAIIYGYSTYIPNEYHIAIPSSEKYTLPKHPAIKLYYWEKKQIELGLKTIKYEDFEIRIFNKEKTVCDFIKFRSKEERSVINQVIKNYLNDKERNLNQLNWYAKELGLKTIVKNYLDILL
jgi:predicted transcriptional regulator of viral defense system